MPSENFIKLELNKCEKSDKAPFINQADLECLKKKD